MLHKLLIIVLATLALIVVAAPAPAQAAKTPCPVDDNGNCMGSCDEWGGSTPDCYLDDSFAEAELDVYYGYGSGTCFNAHASRGGTWWRMHYYRYHICVSGGQVTDPGSPAYDVSTSLPWPLSWSYGPSANFYSEYQSPTPDDYLTTVVSFSFQWCNALVGWPCSVHVYGYMYINVTGYGGVFCYSDKGYIPNCRGRI